MTQRVISTRLAIEGESQYRSAINSVNAELRNMQSALKMTESQYASNAGSTEALTAKQSALNNLLNVQKDKVSQVAAALDNAVEAENKYAQIKENITKKIEENNRALERLKNSTEDTSEEQKKLARENQELSAKLQKNESYLQSARKAVTNWKTELNKAKTAVNETEAAVKKNTDALKENQKGGQKSKEAFSALAAVLVASGLKRGIEEITDALISCGAAAIEFESAMAGVQKTTDMSGADLVAMGKDIMQLAVEIPVTTTEFAKIVETAGQLGIQKDKLIEFSEVMAALGVSTNMTSDEAATMLARFANVTQMSPDLFENLGSVVVALGNNFETTEKEIVEMAQRLAAAGEISGLTEPQIMALATAMSSVGIEAEAGGTAMTQTLTAIERAVATGSENLQKFADISGMSAEQFAEAWKSAPITAVEAFIEGLGGLADKGESATLALEDMGLSGIRQSNMLKSLATASGLMGSAVELANAAWHENTALMTEAGTKYDTTESKLIIFKNSVNNLKIAIGDQLNPALNDITEIGTDAVKWATDFANANSWLGPSIAAVAASLSVLLGVFTTAKLIIPAVTLAVKALNTAWKASPTGIIATGVAMVTAALITYASVLPDVTQKAKELNNAADESAEAFYNAGKMFDDNTETIDATAYVIDSYIDRLEQLDGQTALTKEEQREYNDIVSRLSVLLPDADLAIDTTTKKLHCTIDELRSGAEAWKEYAKQQAFSQLVAEQQTAIIELQKALEIGKMNLAEYNETATKGSLDYAAALMAESEARIALNKALEDSDFKETGEVEDARKAHEEAMTRAGEFVGKLRQDEIETGQAIQALTESIAETESELEKQNSELDKIKQSMLEYEETLDPVAEKTSEMAENAEKASESVKNIGEGAADSMAELPEAIASSMETAQATVESASDEISASIQNIGKEGVSGLSAELGTLSDSVNASMSEVNQAVKANEQPAYDAGKGVGANISAGIAAGLQAGSGPVSAAAAKVVRDAIRAANKAGEIESPSKATRRTGQFLDEGLIAGIRDRERAVTKQMHDLVKNVAMTSVKVPEIPDLSASILATINKGSDQREVVEAIKELGRKKRKDGPKIEVTQNIYGDQTSYAAQQKAAGKELTKLARKLGR